MDDKRPMNNLLLYDLIIVGRGLIGSAAARHAARIIQTTKNNSEFSKSTRKSIALIGPSERQMKEKTMEESTVVDDDNVVYGAHYDEGRITRKTDPDPIWAELAARSIDRYHEIQQDAVAAVASFSDNVGGNSSDNNFYVECGHLAVGAKNGDSITKRIQNAIEKSLPYVKLDSTDDVHQRFPFLNFPNHCEGILESKDAGYVSARGLVAAQVNAAKGLGVDIIDEIVQEVTKNDINKDSHSTTNEKHDDDGTTAAVLPPFTIRCSNNKTFYSKRVLVVTGAFTNARPLLPEPLDLTPVKTQTVHFILQSKDIRRLQGMPTVIFMGETADHWAYMLPPIIYPDGTTRLKLGGSCRVQKDSQTRTMHSTKEVLDWYRRNADADEDKISAMDDMTTMLHSFVPNVVPIRIVTDTCATLNTPTRQPYIGEVSPGWAVATGGNGYAAKSSDELGRLAALCILNRTAFEKERICGKSVSQVMRPIVRTTTTAP